MQEIYHIYKMHLLTRDYSLCKRTSHPPLSLDVIISSISIILFHTVGIPIFYLFNENQTFAMNLIADLMKQNRETVRNIISFSSEKHKHAKPLFILAYLLKSMNEQPLYETNSEIIKHLSSKWLENLNYMDFILETYKDRYSIASSFGL